MARDHVITTQSPTVSPAVSPSMGDFTAESAAGGVEAASAADSAAPAAVLGEVKETSSWNQLSVKEFVVSDHSAAVSLPPSATSSPELSVEAVQIDEFQTKVKN